MGLQKGQTNNRQGRPKGSKNKATKELRGLVSDFLQSKMDNIDAIFDELQPREKVKFITELLSYSLPKYQTVVKDENSSNEGMNPVEFFRSINDQYVQKERDREKGNLNSIQ